MYSPILSTGGGGVKSVRGGGPTILNTVKRLWDAMGSISWTGSLFSPAHPTTNQRMTANKLIPTN